MGEKMSLSHERIRLLRLLPFLFRGRAKTRKGIPPCLTNECYAIEGCFFLPVGQVEGARSFASCC